MKKENLKKVVVMTVPEIKVIHNGVDEKDVHSWGCCYGGYTFIL